MYSQNEIDEAVAAGAISASSADALRTFVEGQRSTSVPDEENFRLLTGFNDIFVSIAAAILLVAVGWIGQSIGQSTGIVVDRGGPSFLGPLAIAGTAWALALFFTARRRMALPSILLVFAFVGAVFATVALVEAQIMFSMGEQELAQRYGDSNSDAGKVMVAILGSIAFAVSAAAAWFHWRTFRVPVTVAAGAAAASGIALALLFAAIGDTSYTRDVALGFVLVLGIAVFLFAMRWDGSDRTRTTRRSDVAFWLHLLAAPMIVHPVFSLLGLNDGSASIAEGVVVIALYVALGITALAIDRRALLVSALAYVLFALQSLFREFGAVELNVALTALVIGSALLSLSAFWHQARSAIVSPLPQSLRLRLPVLDRAAPIPQPAA
ncbi:hypothetical protein G7077_09345 [Sphingomonas piscis]|uniref:DUF2157 domain-containing protein n=1 Tax=Sphingomonas piscis TaxID=2714943 RepID=A0A6G7YQP5_9SPHN|nr:hypothetical protein [Sphingomonas piscis]QIK79065.1 hypothetical protein G7077_09345 [Sphingomonas piscis]